MPNFTHTHIEKHLILEKEKLPDKKNSRCNKAQKRWIQIVQSTRPLEANGYWGSWEKCKPRGVWGHAPPDNFKI